MNNAVSIVTACKNRNDCLEAVLPSWLQYKQVKEIIIVDWSSDTPLSSLTKLDSRIKVIRVDNEDFYIPSQANNLAASFVTNDYILRVDTDYLFNPYYDFFKTYKIDDTCFVSGEPEISSDRENNPYYKYLFGLLYITKDNFNKINGYNENIGDYYSHEDKDIFERLKLLGLKQIKLKNNYSVIHIPHPDKKRFEHFKNGQNTITDEYSTVETHIGKNLQLFNDIKNYYTTPLVKWETVCSNKNYFEVKKINNKLYNLPIVNCISLEESNNRRQTLLKQFKEYNINNINFLLSKRFLESNDLIEGKLAHTLNEGTTGCCISHLTCIKEWIENTNEEIGFFCEDDLSLETVQYWNKNFNDLIEEIPKDWDCIQLLTIRNDNLSLNVRDRLWNDWGATAYIIKRSYAKKIINTYCRDNVFILELPEPNTNIQPLIENLIFLLGKTYVLPLFIENINFPSTFVKTDNDVNAATLHKNNHILAAEKMLNLWKNNSFSHKSNDMKVVDCFSFFNEKELLELRIKLLYDYVDEFVILDGNYTHSGTPKNYTCKQIIDELELPKDKITVVEVDLSESGCGAPTEYDLYYAPGIKCGTKERVQRDYIQKLLSRYDDDTVFIISDCDEIINPVNINFIADIVRTNPNVICKIPLIYLQGRADFRVFIKNTDQPYPWDLSMFFATKKQLEKISPTQIRANFNIELPITYVTQNNIKIEDLGWHFSWMGDRERLQTKATSFCHYGQTLENCIYKNCFGEDLAKFLNEYELIEGNVPISGHIDACIKKFSIEKLPKIIFTLPNVKDFLLPEIKKNKTVLDYFAVDIENPLHNFNTGLYYYNAGHTAPALSFFLRCAERTDNKLLAYEALIYGYLCYKEQKIRDETAKSLIMHALCLMPERPEARWLMSIFYELKEFWMYSYYHAVQGLKYCDKNFEPLKCYKNYPGKIGLLFQKAVSGYWWGKNEECKNILLDLYHNYELNDIYIKGVKSNLERIGVEIT